MDGAQAVLARHQDSQRGHGGELIPERLGKTDKSEARVHAPLGCLDKMILKLAFLSVCEVEINLNGVIIEVEENEIREVFEVRDGRDLVVLVVQQPHALLVPQHRASYQPPPI